MGCRSTPRNLLIVDETHVLEKDTGPSEMIATGLYLFEVHDTVRLSPQIPPFTTIPPSATIDTAS